jgi:hypothetical protein
LVELLDAFLVLFQGEATFSCFLVHGGAVKVILFFEVEFAGFMEDFSGFNVFAAVHEGALQAKTSEKGKDKSALRPARNKIHKQ